MPYPGIRKSNPEPPSHHHCQPPEQPSPAPSNRTKAIPKMIAAGVESGRVAMKGPKAFPMGCRTQVTTRQIQVSAQQYNSGGNHLVPRTLPPQGGRMAGGLSITNMPTPFWEAPAPTPVATLDGAFKASGKTVVITGGSQGIGRATALLFARKGYNVVVAARDATKLQYVANDCAEAAGRQGASLGVVCDVTDEKQVRNLANTVLSRFENVDVLVNNAGIMTRGAFCDVPAAEADKIMRTNYLGAYHVTQAFVPLLMKEATRKSGHDRPSIIMVNSFCGKVPMKHMSAFTASKYALMGFTEAIRSELEPCHIHVGQVHPGMVKTNHMERTSFFGKDEAEDRKTFRQGVRALPISQTPQEVADAIWNAAMNKQNDVVVGAPFAAVDLAYRMTGINPMAMPFAMPKL